ncbi:MAG: ATP-dependent DNA helicase RecG [Acidobacteriota bacterium]
MQTIATQTSRRVLDPEAPVQYVKGIGPRRAERLAALGVRSVSDLLNHPPFRYEDRTRFLPLKSLQEGQWALVGGTIISAGAFQTQRRKMSIFEMRVQDRTGTVAVKFFNQPYLRNVYQAGLPIIVYGQVRRDPFARDSLCFMNPECEIDREQGESSVHSGRVVPIYRKLADLRTRALRQIIHTALQGLPADLPDPLPDRLRARLRLMSRRQALAAVHFPNPAVSDPVARARELEALNRGVSPAHKRFIFEELFEMQVALWLVRRKQWREVKERRVRITDGVRRAIKRILPFHPTAAQKRVLKDIADDMMSERPMSRLLQGDVGSGKTIVAAQAAIIAVENGFQVAVMAPTEILAEQHFLCFRRLLRPLGYGIDLLKGGLPAKQKREAAARIEQGHTQLVIGTHALIQDPVAFRNLGLAVIDEQHRFGVIQRTALREKGRRPDVLVMTATPIPRSLALTLYGDLDVSVIDQMPPGRLPVETLRYREKERWQAYEAIRRAVSAGHQVYVVYPLVEETEKTDLLAATQMAEHLSTRVFADTAVGLLHGRMKGEQKEAVMGAFAGGEIRILVSTTVIEVGVDVPNATLMVIEHAERFGLAQLHQLRGRVGRGAARSRCILISPAEVSPEAQRRLAIMMETNDGFRIAEVDMELRGPGEVAGTRQAGLPVFQYADLARDLRALELAREEAGRVIEAAEKGADQQCRKYVELVRARWRDRYGHALIG